LHLVNNNDRPAVPDRLHKIRPLITYFNTKFSTEYTPSGHVTVDESMVKFKGRVSFRQYMPAKPTKWGVKIWSLCESTTGYLHKFQIYTGKEADQERGLSHRVVMDMVSHLQNTNVRVFMDNFYTSTGLLSELKMRGIYACGTVRANRRGLPTQLLPKNLKLAKHQYREAQNDDLTFCTWMDTKPVTLLSNFHSPGDTGFVYRRTGHPEQQPVLVPKVLVDYQKHMRGVYLMDQMTGYYQLDHRSTKWWRRLFFFMQMAAVHNSYIIAKDTNPDVARREWPSFQNFVEDLAEGLIGDYQAERDPPHSPQCSSGPTSSTARNAKPVWTKEKGLLHVPVCSRSQEDINSHGMCTVSSGSLCKVFSSACFRKIVLVLFGMC